MARPGGNPDFGSKYRFDYGREEPLTEQVKVLMHPLMKSHLKELAEQKNTSIPELIREAIQKYISEEKTKTIVSMDKN